MANHTDEFNDYGIKNPDGINISYTDYQRVSSLNDIGNFIQEQSSSGVKETQSIKETISSRGSDYVSNKSLDLTSTIDDIQNIQSQTAASTSGAVSASTAAATTTTAATTTAAATSTAAATMSLGAVSVGGAIASAVATMVVVAAVVVNSFALVVSFLSATFNSLAFEVSIENNEEMEEFRAVLYDENEKICKELTISESQIVIFDDLDEGKLYTFVVYDKDEIIKYKQSYLTSTRKAYEDDISIEIVSKTKNKLSFALYLPQEIAKDVYTIRVSEVGGKELYATDDSSPGKLVNLNVSTNNDLIIKVSFGNRSVYQYRVAKTITYNEPTFDWDNIVDDKVIATFVATQDPSIVKQIEVPVSYSVYLDPTIKEDGVENMYVDFEFEGQIYQASSSRAIPATIKDYELENFYWVDKGLDDPKVTLMLRNKLDGSLYSEQIPVTISSESTIDMTHTTNYSAVFEVKDVKFEDTHEVVLDNYSVGLETDIDSINFATGYCTATAYIYYMFNNSEVEKEETVEQVRLEILGDCINHYFEFRGDSLLLTDEPIDGEYAIGDNYYRLISRSDDEAQEWVFSKYYDNGATSYTIPNTIYGLPVTTIGSNSFTEAESLKTLTVGSSVTGFEEYAFADSPMTTITFTNSLTEIVEGMFSYAKVSASQILTNAPNLLSIGDCAFEGATDSVITIPSTVTTIGSGAFGMMENLTTINTHIVGGDSSKMSSNDAYEENYFAYIFTQEDASNWSSGGRCMATWVDPSDSSNTTTYYTAQALTINYTGSVVPVLGFSNTSAIQMVRLNNVVTIKDKAFYDTKSSGDFSLIIANTVTTIGDEAFAYSYPDNPNPCTISIGDGTAPLTIGSRAFANNNAITSLTIPTRTIRMGENMLDGCTSLESLSTPFVGLTQTSTGVNGTFGIFFGEKTGSSPYGCKDLTMDADSVTRNYPESLTTIEITGTEIQDSAFAVQSGTNNTFTTLSIRNATTIGANAFENCTDLQTVYVYSELSVIKDNAFNQCRSLATFSIQSYDTLEDIGYAAFQSTNIATFGIGANLKHVGAYSFNLGDSFSTFNATMTAASQSVEEKWYCVNNPNILMTVAELRPSFLSYACDQELKREDYVG